MKKIISYALVVGVLSLGAMTQASAGYVANIIDEANYLRATHISLNKKASETEALIRHYKACGYATYHLEKKARMYRKKAKRLALEANALARKAFDYGYKRPGYGYTHSHGSHYH